MKTIISILILIIAVLIAWVVVLYGKKDYEILYKQEQAKVYERNKIIDSLQSEKKSALKEAEKLKAKSNEAEKVAIVYQKKAIDFKSKYEAVRDSLISFDTITREAALTVTDYCDSTISSLELQSDYLIKSITTLDSSILRQKEAQTATELMFLNCQLNNDSKDAQMKLLRKQLNAQKRKTIALGTIGGVLVAGALAGVIAVSVAK